MAKVIYCDSDRPDNTGDGLTPETAKRRPREALQAAVAGDTILFRRDRFYDPFGGFFPVINKSNITYDAYGTGALPCFDGLTYENYNTTGAGWTYEGSGIWSKIFGAGKTLRLWVGGYNNGNLRSQRNPGVAYRRGKRTITDTLPSILANLNANDIWWGSGSALQYRTFVYTGSSTIAPPEYYKGLTALTTDGSTFGGAQAASVNNAQNVLVQNIESWGSTGYCFTIFTATTDATPVRNVTFRNCVGKYMFTGMFRAAPSTTEANNNPRVEISNVLVDNCYADSGTSVYEQEPDETNYGNLGGAMDMYVLYDGVKNCVVRNSTSINSFHVAFALGSYGMNSLWTDNCGFENCLMYADEWHTYSRGAATNGCYDNCYIRNCVFDGQNVYSNLSGGAMISGNKWINNRISSRKPNGAGWISISATITTRSNTSVGNERYVITVPTNLRIVNNLVIDPVGLGIGVDSFSPYNIPGVDEPVIKDDSVTIANNVVIDRVRATPRLVQIFSNATTVGRVRVLNNAVYTGSESRPASTISVQNVPMALSAYTGSAENLETDPKINISDPLDPLLMRDSPLRRAGKFLGHLKDSRGRPFMIPPTIGPLEYTAKSYRKE